MTDLSSHWNSTFASKADAELGWYESDLMPTFQMLEAQSLQSRRVFLAGAGTTTLIEPLLERGALLHLNDLSSVALDQVRHRIGFRAETCVFEVADLGAVFQGEQGQFDLWIDRAVLHFLTESAQIAAYFDRLRRQLKVGGHVLLAEFTHGGALKCNGLCVKHWNVAEMSVALGAGFRLVQSFDHTFFNPKGDPRPYVYALFEKVE